VVPGRAPQREILVKGENLDGGKQWMLMRAAAEYWGIPPRLLRNRLQRMVQEGRDDYEYLCAVSASSAGKHWRQQLQERAVAAKVLHPVLHPGWVEFYTENTQVL